MIKSNKNMLKMLVALAFTMSPVFAVAACNPSTKHDKAKLKTGDLNKLRIIAPEIEAFNNVRDKASVTKDEITTVVNTIVKPAIDQIATKTDLNVDYRIKIEKDSKIITGPYNLTSKTDLDRTFDIIVIKLQTEKLKGILKSQRIVFPELKGSEEVATKAVLSTLTNIDSPITVEATENTDTSDANIKTAVEAKILEVVKNLPNGTAVEATDLEITVKKENGTDNLDATTSLATEITVSVTVKASDADKTKLEGEKTITVKIAKITPVVAKADLSKLEAIDSPITVEATENTDTSDANIKTAVEAKILEVVKNLPNGTAVEATDLEITVKKENGTDNLDATTSLATEITVSVTVKASDADKTKLEGEKTITVKIAKITPVVAKADLSKLEAIDSPITVEATENTDTSDANIKTAVEAKILEVVKNLPNGTAVEATDLEITVKKENGTDNLDATTSLATEITVSVTVKASDADKTKLEGEKTITVKIAKITPVVAKADLSKLEAIDSPITVEATENTDTSDANIKTAVEAKILEVVKNLPNGTAVEATDLEITVKKENGTDNLDATTSLATEITVSVTVKASDADKTKLEGEKTITVKIAKITPVVAKADLSKLEAIDSPITVEATENTDTSDANIKTAVEAKILEVVKNLPNGTAVEATDLEITVKKENGTDNLDATTSLATEITVSVTVKASDADKTKLEGEKTITVKIAQLI